MFKFKKSFIFLGVLLLLEIVLFNGMDLRDAFGLNFFLISVAAIPIWIVGLIRPSLIIRWGDPLKRNRKSVSKYSLILFAVSMILFVVVIPKTSPLEQAFEDNEIDNTVISGKPINVTIDKVNPTESVNSEAQKAIAPSYFLEAKVTGVTDGDTFTVKLKDGSSEKVRLLLIDTPETKHPTKPIQPFGPEASAYTTKILTGQSIKLEFDISERDQYGRILAYAYLGDKMVNEMLLEKGYARVAVYQPDVKYVDQFRAIQKVAQAGKLGIWSIEDYATDTGYNESVVASPSPKPIVIVKPTATKKPAPVSTKNPVATSKPKATATPEPVEEDYVFYQNCSAVRAAGADPIYAGDPGYSSKLDRDGDGVGCE